MCFSRSFAGGLVLGNLGCSELVTHESQRLANVAIGFQARKCFLQLCRALLHVDVESFDAVVGRLEVLADALVAFLDVACQLGKTVGVCSVMLLVLRLNTSNDLVKCHKLVVHLRHLFVNDTDCLAVDSIGRLGNIGSVIICRCPVALESGLDALSRLYRTFNE